MIAANMGMTTSEHEAAINPAPVAPDRLEHLAHRASMFADGMNFRLLYDEARGLLSIGYRPADAEGPGRLDNAYALRFEMSAQEIAGCGIIIHHQHDGGVG